MGQTTNERPPDYVLIGHISHDRTPQGARLGGTVAYGARTVRAFGLRVGVLTSADPRDPVLADLPSDVELVNVAAEHSTTFENRYEGNVRTQWMYHRAHPLTPDMLPSAWRAARLVHLAPIADEVAADFAAAFEGARLCVTPQGWMRRRASDNRVLTRDWADAEQVLPRCALAVLSEEDIRHAPELEQRYARLAPLFVLTRAERGGTVYHAGQAHDFAAYPVARTVDPTGAGDIFTTALHIALARLGELGAALRVATYLAAQSVTRVGLEGAPTVDEVARAWQFAAERSI